MGEHKHTIRRRFQRWLDGADVPRGDLLQRTLSCLKTANLSQAHFSSGRAFFILGKGGIMKTPLAACRIAAD